MIAMVVTVKLCIDTFSHIGALLLAQLHAELFSNINTMVVLLSYYVSSIQLLHYFTCLFI